MPRPYTSETGRAAQALSVRARNANKLSRLIAALTGPGPHFLKQIADDPAPLQRALESGDDRLVYQIFRDAYEMTYGKAAQTHLVAAQVEVRMSESTAARIDELAARVTPLVTLPVSTSTPTDAPAPEGTESTKY